MAATNDVHLEFVWKPRSTACIQDADELSRVIDPSDFHLQKKFFVQICKTLDHTGRPWGFPTCDVFAGGNDHEHHAKIYFTLFYCPGTAGINGLQQSWQGRSPIGKPALSWMFPPFKLIGAALKRLTAERVDAILILPHKVKYWFPMLQQLPIVATREIPYHVGLLFSGSRLPEAMRTTSLVYRLKAYLVRFS